MGAAELIPLGSSSAPDGAVWDSCRAGSLLSGCSTSCCVPRRPSGIPEEDIRSTLVPYFLKHRSYLRRVLREKEEENRKVAESVLMGRDRIAELQQLIQARQQAWQVKTDQTKPNQPPPRSTRRRGLSGAWNDIQTLHFSKTSLAAKSC